MLSKKKKKKKGRVLRLLYLAFGLIHKTTKEVRTFMLCIMMTLRGTLQSDSFISKIRGMRAIPLSHSRV